MLVDSHCHLDFESLYENLPAVLSNAKECGVDTILTIATNRSNINIVKDISKNNTNIWCSVGIHPHSVISDYLTYKQLLQLSNHSKVVGIGETGLDYYYNYSPKNTQVESFLVHCQAAKKSNLPIIIHNRNSDTDMIHLLQAESGAGQLRGVVHCFTSSKELARVALDLGFYISFSGIVTFKNSDAVRDIARYVPEERILVETDAPYLSPEPHRGKKNQPAYVKHTAQFVAELRKMTFNQLSELTTNNFFNLFDKCSRPT